MTVDEYCDVLNEVAELGKGHGGVNLPSDEVKALAAIVAAGRDVVEQYVPGDLDADPETYADEIVLRDAIAKVIDVTEKHAAPGANP